MQKPPEFLSRLYAWLKEPIVSIEQEHIEMRKAIDAAMPLVYFIVPIGDAPQVVKIGTSTRITERLNALNCASPVKLECIGVITGDRTLEMELHKRFAEFRTNREWFSFTPPIRDYIEENTISLQKHLKLLGEIRLFVDAWYQNPYNKARNEFKTRKEILFRIYHEVFGR